MKKLFSLILVLSISLFLVGCKKENKEETTVNYTNPEISEAEKVIFSGKYNELDYKVTKSDVYDAIRYYGGLSLLLQQLDETLLASEVSALTTSSPEYVSRYNRLVYSTSDPLEIQALSADEKLEDETVFNNTLKIMGIETEAEKEAYIKLLAARDVVTRKWLENEVDTRKSDLYASEDTLKEWYKSSYNTTCKALIVNFENMKDYENTIKKEGLVSYNSELRKYTGTTPIAEVSQSELSSENTTALEENEVFGYFVKFYNTVYGSYRTAIDENYEGVTLTFSTLSLDASQIAKYVFNMKENEYTYAPLKSTTSAGTTYSLIYRIDAGKADYDTLSQDEKAQVKAAYIDELVENSSNVVSAMAEKRADANISFFDKYFAFSYSSVYDTDIKWKNIEGSSTVLVKADGIEITADSFYNYAMQRSAEYMVLYASQLKINATINEFSKLYGTERDLSNNGSLRMVYYYDTLKNAITQEYSEATYECEEVYLYNKFGYNSFNKSLLRYYVESDLKTALVFDQLINVDENNNASFKEGQASTDALAIIDSLYDNYYDLTAHLINVTTDLDGDFVTDDLAAVIADPTEFGLTITSASITDKLASLHAIIKFKLDECDSLSEATAALSDFVTEYNKSSRTDGTYATYKAFGFKVSYSSQGEQTYASKRSSNTDVMNAKYKALYDEKITASTYSKFAYADEFAVDENGAHFILGVRATDSGKKPSFIYTVDADDKDSINANAAGTTDKPSLGQFANSFYLYYCSLIYTNKDTAEKTFESGDRYPLSYPSSLKFDAYNEVIKNYFMSDNWINGFYCDVLTLGNGEGIDSAKFAEFKTIYDYFLNQNPDIIVRP